MTADAGSKACDSLRDRMIKLIEGESPLVVAAVMHVVIGTRDDIAEAFSKLGAEILIERLTKGLQEMVSKPPSPPKPAGNA